MQVTETKSDGLAREFKIVVGADDLEGRLSGRLEEIKGQVHMKGFRPGKVPVAFLRKLHGKGIMAEIIQDVVTGSVDEAVSQNAIRPAGQPDFDMPESLDDVIDGKADLEFSISMEILPDIELMDFASIKLDRPAAKVEEAAIDEAVEGLASQQNVYKARRGGSKAKEGDQVNIDFVGSVDGVEFEGGKGENFPLVLGSGQFIPGFEDQLIGAKKGDDVDVNVTFPEDYQSSELKGKDALFKVMVQEVSAPEKPEINDDFAAQMGLENLEKLRELVRDRIASDYGAVSRDVAKKALLDILDEKHPIDLPQKMVEAEFNQIWQQVLQESGEEEVDESEKSEFHDIAERRVRLGLVLAEVGNANNIQVSQEELSRAMADQARGFPGQEQQIYQFYQQNPTALQQLRAPIFEEKVVDFIFEMAEITEVEVSVEELQAMASEEEAPAKEAKKATKKKAAPKKKAAAKKKTAKKKTAKAKDEKPAEKKAAPKKKAAAKKKTAKKTTKKAAKKTAKKEG